MLNNFKTLEIFTRRLCDENAFKNAAGIKKDFRGVFDFALAAMTPAEFTGWSKIVFKKALFICGRKLTDACLNKAIKSIAGYNNGQICAKAELLLIASDCKLELAQAGEAQKYISSLSKIASRFEGEEADFFAARYRIVKGRLACLLAKYKKARENFDIAIKFCAENKALCASALDYAGHADYYAGHYDAALNRYEAAIKLIKNKNKNTALTARLYNDFGAAYSKKGDFLKAELYLKKSANLAKRMFGENHPLYAFALNNLGETALNRDRYGDAIAYYNSALKIRLAFYGSENPYTAATYNDIGDALFESGDYIKALAHYKKALRLRITTMGERHPAVATCYNNMGLLYSCKNDYKKALFFHQKSLDIKLSSFGTIHPYISISYHNMASMYASMGQYEKAVHFFEKSLDMDRNYYNESHPKIIESINFIAMIFAREQKYDLAALYYGRAIDSLKESAGNFQAIGRLHCDLAGVYFEVCDFDEAASHYRLGIAFLEKNETPDPRSLIEAYFHIGAIYQKRREYEPAAEHYARCVELQKAAGLLPDDYTEEFCGNFLLGLLYYKSKRYPDSIRHFECCTKFFKDGKINAENELGEHLHTINGCINEIMEAYGN